MFWRMEVGLGKILSAGWGGVTILGFGRMLGWEIHLFVRGFPVVLDIPSKRGFGRRDERIG
jgi:hypothetical protein